MSTPIAHPNWKLRARIWICIMFLLLGGADYLLVRFSMNEFNPAPALLGVAVMGGLGTKLLLIGMWRRMSWTRYTLGLILVLSIMAFSGAMFYIIGGTMTRPDGMVRPGLAGIGLQALVLIPLAKSRSIRRQMHPLTNAGS